MKEFDFDKFKKEKENRVRMYVNRKDMEIVYNNSMFILKENLKLRETVKQLEQQVKYLKDKLSSE